MTVLLVFAVVVAAELAVFVWIESMIGLGNVILVALATAVAGSLLVRRAGSAVLAELRDRLGEGRVPARELTHGAAVLVAGALLISPGFVTDVIGFLLLVPGVRDLVHRNVTRWMRRRVTVVAAPGFGPPTGVRPDDHEIIDVESWEER